MKVINTDTWNRKTQYENFIGYTDPTFSVGTRLDVTELLSFCKRTGRSFFPSFLYFVIRAINEVKEMRIRLKGDQVVLFDKVDPSYIVICEDEQITTCQNAYDTDFDRFHDAVRATVDKAKQNGKAAQFNPEIVLDCVYISCLPWVDITSAKNPYDLKNREQTSIPRILWGKYVQNPQGRFELGFDIAAHHALIDGAQICRVMQKLASALCDPEAFIKGGSTK